MTDSTHSLDDAGDDLRRVCTVAALGLAAVVPLDPVGWFPFSIAKWWTVIAVVLVAVAAWSRSISLRPRRPVVALGVLCALVALSAMTGLDRHHALLGTAVRHLGVVAWVSFALSFLVGAAIVRGAGDRALDSVAKGAVVVGLVSSTYVAWEAAIGRPVDFTAVSDRLGGSFGSPAYLGAMSAMLLPMSIGIALDAGIGPRWRWFATSSAAGSFVAVVGSGSRSALISLAVVAVVAMVVRRAALATVIVRVGVVCAVGSIAVAAGVRQGVFERSAGWATRLDEWGIAARVIGNRPLLGTGPEGYRIAAFEAATDDYVVRFGDAVGTDRAHSGVLDVAAASGVVAAAAYVVALVLVGRCAIAAVRSGSAASAGVAAGVITYGLGQQLLFPIAEIDPLFWLLSGAVCARSLSKERATGEGMWRRAAAVGCVAVAGIVGVAGVRHVAADRLARDAVRADDSVSAESFAEQSVALAPDDLRLRVLLGQIQSSTRSVSAIDRANATIQAAVERSPLDPVVRIEAARLVSLTAEITGDADDRQRARDAWASLTRDAPACARCHLGAGLAAAERGDSTDALRSLRRAAALGNARAAEIIARSDDG